MLFLEGKNPSATGKLTKKIKNNKNSLTSGSLIVSIIIKERLRKLYDRDKDTTRVSEKTQGLPDDYLSGFK